MCVSDREPAPARTGHRRPRRPGLSLAGEVAATLRGQLEDGRYRAGERLPSEPDLARDFGISRATLREAVRILVEEGYLRRVHGSGTYAARRPMLRNSLDINFGVTDLIRAMGRTPSTVESSREVRTADADTAVALGIEEGDEVVMLRRVRAADGTPVVLSIDVLPAALVGDGDAEPLQDSIYHFLAERGTQVDHGVARILPALADPFAARGAAVPVGTLLLYLHQVDYDAAGEPVVLSREYHVAEAFEVSVYRKGPFLTRTPPAV